MRGLVTPRKLKQVIAQYETFRNENVLPASFEIVYGHAWKIDKKNRQVSGEIKIPVKDISAIKK